MKDIPHSHPENTKTRGGFFAFDLYADFLYARCRKKQCLISDRQSGSSSISNAAKRLTLSSYLPQKR